jgi:hypothetical protein
LKDIVFCRTERGVIGHRLVRIANRNGKLVLLARGDADKGASEPVAPAQILCRLVAVERDGRCIDLAGRKAKVKHSIQDQRIALQTADRSLTDRQARKFAFPFNLIDLEAAG